MFIMQYNHEVELTLRHLSICILYIVYGWYFVVSVHDVYIQRMKQKEKIKFITVSLVDSRI